MKVKVKPFKKPNCKRLGYNTTVSDHVLIDGNQYFVNKIYTVEADFYEKYQSTFTKIEENE